MTEDEARQALVDSAELAELELDGAVVHRRRDCQPRLYILGRP
jgi:hypothetical protein